MVNCPSTECMISCYLLGLLFICMACVAFAIYTIMYTERSEQSAKDPYTSSFVQDITNTGAPGAGLWAELHSRESGCVLRLSRCHYKFQECAVRLHTINREPLRSSDQHVRPIHALTTILYACD